MSTQPTSVPQFPDNRRENFLERPLPSSDESERVILGAILLDNSVIAKVAETLLPEEFYSPFHRMVYKAMLSLFQQGKRIDPILIGENIKEQGDVTFLGGVSTITNLTFGLPHFTDIDKYIEIVQDKAKRRDFARHCAAMQVAALDESLPSDQLFDNAEQELFKLNHQKNKHVAEDATALLNKTAVKHKEITERIARGEKFAVGVTTGLTDLDEILGGWRRGDLIVLAGRPSMGKTSLGVQCAVRAAMSDQDNYKAAVFSLEMTKEQLANRILCGEARVSGTQWQRGWVRTEGWERVAETVGTFPFGRLFVDDEPGITPMQLRAKCRRLITEHKRLDLVVVDYLGLMNPSTKVRNQSTVQTIGDITKELKAVAKDLDVPILVLSQLSRAPEGRNPPKPILSDLRDSGHIEQDADVVLFIYREEYYDKTDENAGLAEIIVAKQRNGPTEDVKTAFLREFTRFENFIAN